MIWERQGEDWVAHKACLNGKLRIPASKSVSHRVYLLAALSQRPVTIHNALRAADPEATRSALQAMGARCIREGAYDRFEPAELRGGADLNLENAGTGLRLLTALAATLPGSTGFTGDASLQSRTNQELLDVLAAGGAEVEGGPYAPYRIGGPLTESTFELPAKCSSQYASALSLILPLLPSGGTVRLAPPLRSSPYHDITLNLMRLSGIDLDDHVLPSGERVTRVEGNQQYQLPDLEVEGDWSTAAFAMVAAAITGGTIAMEGLLADSLQADRKIVEILQAFGHEASSTHVVGKPSVSPGQVDVSQCPDLFPILSILAAASQGTTTFVGGEALRHKESDRIQAMVAGLRQLGVDAQETPDGAIVAGGGLHGGRVDARHDHRVHMSFAIAGLIAEEPVFVSDPGSVAVSDPQFHTTFGAILA